MYTDAKKNFERLSAKGLVGKNYTHILAMLMRFVSLFVHFTQSNLIHTVYGVLSFTRILFSPPKMNLIHHQVVK
jgi:hypothetical protein